MKIEKEQLELAARIFLSEQPKDLTTGEVLADRLTEVKLHQKFYSENKNGADLCMYANGNNKGWVLLSADTDLPAVWADSDKEFEGDGVCPSFEMIVGSYLEEITSILERIKESANKNDEESLSFMKTIAGNQLQWEKLFDGELTQCALYSGTGANTESNGRSNLVNSSWNQDGQYNGSINRYCQQLVPTSSGQYLVGCGAVALAQILRQRALAKCDPKHEGIVVHGNANYNWRGHQITDSLERIWHSTMMPTAIWCTTPQNQKDEVMNFLRDVAFMIKSNFGTNATSSNFGDTRDAIRKYIGGGTCSEIMYNDNSFWEWIRNEVTAQKRPVLVRGSKGQSGHAFIIDGYNREYSLKAFGYEDYYHWNMGWGYEPGSEFWGRGCNYMQDMAAIFEIDLKN